MNSLRDAISEIDEIPNKKSELTLSLNLLLELTKQKQDIQKEALMKIFIATTEDTSKTIPVNIMTRFFSSDTVAYNRFNELALIGVTGTVKEFIKGSCPDVITNIEKFIKRDLAVILETKNGTQAEFHAYYIFIEESSIRRLDIMAWQRRIEATSIIHRIENVITFTVATSVLDLSRTTLHKLLFLYNEQLYTMNLTDNRRSELLEKAEAIFKLMTNSSGNKILIK